MPRLTQGEFRKAIDLGGEVITGAMEDIFITKRMIMREGISEEKVNSYIRTKGKQYEAVYMEMSDKVFFQMMNKTSAKQIYKKKDEEANPASKLPKYHWDISDYDSLEYIRLMLNLIDNEIKRVERMKRAMLYSGADPDAVDKAIREVAVASNEKAMKMTDEEAGQAMMERLNKRMENYQEFQEEYVDY